MLEIQISYNKGDKEETMNVYIDDPAPKAHPLENQNIWLSKRMGSTIPPETMNGFSDLKKFSTKHNINFKELCYYAFLKDKNEADFSSQLTKAVKLYQSEFKAIKVYGELKKIIN